MSKGLSRDDILSCNDLKIEELDLTEEWGGPVYIQSLDGYRQDEFQELTDGEYKKNTLAKVAIMVVCDEDGKPLFTNKDTAQLNRKSSAALNKILRKVIEMNVVNDEDIDDMAKNS